MKNKQKIGAIIGIVFLTALSNPMTMVANEGYGASATTENREYTIAEMLQYAIEDEYIAQAEYNVIIEQYGEIRPFSNIVKAEARHIEMLTPLFAEHAIELPENIASSYISLPSLTEIYSAGVEAEINNIAMYEKFLAQELPDDIRTVFEYLKSASENHLRAFERNNEREATATGENRRSGRERG